MKHQQVSATDFKAKCLSLMDEIDATGGSVTITKRGKPIAVLQCVQKKARKSLAGHLAGKVKIVGDIVNVSFAEDWESVREADAAASAGKGKR